MNRFISFALCYFLFEIYTLPLPDHCYEFIAPSVQDECGSHHLSRHGEVLLTLLENSGSPMCDDSGCQFSDGGSYFSAQVPSGFTLNWTLSFWAREVFSTKAGIFSIVKVSM